MSRPNSSRAFLGTGWTFPVCLQGGRIQMAHHDVDIREAIRIILRTNRKERLMRPEFGASLSDFVFESISTETMERIRVRVNEALIDWEPRVDVLGVTVTVDESEPNKLLIEATYRVRSSNTQQNLVYPFYLQEGTAK
jgi:hypothetical protein